MEKSCSRCKRTENLEKHHIIFKSQGGSDKKSNLRNLCRDCHDYIHTESKVVDEIKHNLNSIKWWAEHFRSKNADQVIRRIEYKIKRIKLLTKRLQVLRELNSIENIKIHGYRTYWVNTRTH